MPCSIRFSTSISPPNSQSNITALIIFASSASASRSDSPPSSRFSFMTTAAGAGEALLSDRAAAAAAVPKFKSATPPSLPISPPSSYFLIPQGFNPALLLDSPVLLSSSNILPSPTTGALSGRNSNVDLPAQFEVNDNFFSDFAFQTQSQISNEAVKEEQSHHYQQQEQQPRDLRDQKTESNDGYQHQPSQYVGEQKTSDDGYNWRKYGQKQVKASENPRSYFKCTFPGCPMKKKVERSLDGRITEIIYSGSHNHPKPVNARRSSSSASSSMAIAASVIPSQAIAPAAFDGSLVDSRENSFGSGMIDPSVTTPENSSTSIADDEADREDFHGDEREAKRWKGEGESEYISTVPANRTLREPRVVVQTKSDIDILEDGYRWRKYGQKVVRGNPNPRSYYKCTFPRCGVRKHVERAAHDRTAVVTTYEGKHNHEVPAARSSSHSASRPPVSDHATIPSTHLYDPRVMSSSDGQSRFFLQMIRNPLVGSSFPGSETQQIFLTM